MPVYCYETEDGTIIERVFKAGDAPKQIILSDPGEAERVAKRSFQAEGVKSASPSGWPMTCCASGVNAEQAGELRSHFAEKGIPTEVTKDGDPIYTSSAHRKKALKARGFHDKDSYS